jgi:hypothetical protein
MSPGIILSSDLKSNIYSMFLDWRFPYVSKQNIKCSDKMILNCNHIFHLMAIWVIPFSPAVGFALIIQGVRLDAIGNTNLWSFSYMCSQPDFISYISSINTGES